MMLERAINNTEGHRDQYSMMDRDTVLTAVTALEHTEIDMPALIQYRIGHLVNNIRRKLAPTESELKKRLRVLVQKWQKLLKEVPAPDQNGATAAQDAQSREEKLRIRLQTTVPSSNGASGNGTSPLNENGDDNHSQKKKVNAKRRSKKGNMFPSHTDEIKAEALRHSANGGARSRSPVIISPAPENDDRRVTPVQVDSTPNSPMRKRVKAQLRADTPTLLNLSKLDPESPKPPVSHTTADPPVSRVPSTANPSPNLNPNSPESAIPQFSAKPRFIPSVSPSTHHSHPKSTPQDEDIVKSAKDDTEWEGVSGVRDTRGNFHRWHDEILLEPEGTEPFFHILPYVDLDFDLL